MVITHPEEDGPRVQNNYGPGTQIGGDNYGIIEMVDAKTKAVLDKLSRDAPDLGRLLSKALRDGVISPDAAIALDRAARNINGDVAHALLIAGQNINEHVAELLRNAGLNINESVAERFHTASDRLDHIADSIGQEAGRLELALNTNLSVRLDTILDNVSSEAARIERLFTPPPPEIIINWKATAYAFLAGLGVGAVLISIIMTAH